MMLIRKTIITAVAATTLTLNAFALKPFTLKKIEVKGLQRIKYGTVLNYVPLHPGQKVTQEKADSIVRALHHTGFFKLVNVYQAGRNLIIEVQEKPTIAAIAVYGNKMIPSEQINQVFEQYDLVKGRIFNEAIFTRIKEELERQYALQGHYGAHIDVEKKILSDNRIRVTVDVNEGAPARIQQIEITGNKHFSNSRLMSQMVFKPTNLYYWFFDQDRYGREKFEASLEAIRSFYMDRGFINIRFLKQHVLISPDKKSVFVKIKLQEGKQFSFGEVKFKGALPLKEEMLRKEVRFHPGDIFSRKKMNEATKAITDRLGDFGYLPAVDAEPVVDAKTHRVAIHFLVRTGPRVYVNRIQFSGNDKTADYVLRYAMQQHEAERFSVRHVRESERHLRILEYFEDVSSETIPVPGKNNQVDLLFKLKEKPAAKATLSAGYGGTAGFQFSASINQPNFLGTGRKVSTSVSLNNMGQHYAASYYDPYYYSNRVGRGFNFSYDKRKYGKRNDVEAYKTRNFNGGVNYSIRMTDHAYLQMGLAFDHLSVPTYQHSPISQYTGFYTRNGEYFNTFKLTGGWNYNSYNKFPFPSEGWHQEASATLAIPPSSNKDLSYYKVFFRNQGYYPLPKEFTLTGGMALGYANGFKGDDYPIYENFFAGGIGFAGQVRGFYAASLGPKGVYTEKGRHGNAIGGNTLVAMNAGVILPYPFSRPTFRSTVFTDVGNVYARGLDRSIAGVNSGPLRVSGGISFDWRSPFGPMVISVAEPVNARSSDRTRLVDFTISTGF